VVTTFTGKHTAVSSKISSCSMRLCTHTDRQQRYDRPVKTLGILDMKLLTVRTTTPECGSCIRSTIASIYHHDNQHITWVSPLQVLLLANVQGDPQNWPLQYFVIIYIPLVILNKHFNNNCRHTHTNFRLLIFSLHILIVFNHPC